MVQPQTIITQSAQETFALGEALGHRLVKEGSARLSHLICLYGELGSGKTTFAQGFAKGIGISTRLLSPTFIIVRRYSLKSPFTFFYHIDLYRLSQEEELNGLGISEIFADSNSLILVEWAEKLKALLPSGRIDIRFLVEEDGAHRITTEYL